MTRNATARLAGLLYFLTVPAGTFALLNVLTLPQDDIGAAVAAIEANRRQFELAILAGAFTFVDYIVLVLVCHRLLAPFGKFAANLMVLLVMASVPLSLMAMARRLDVLSLLDAGSALPALSAEQVQFQIGLALQSDHNLFTLSAIFWGLWLVPLGWLAIRSGFIPRLIGLLLIGGGFGYLSVFVFPLLGAGFAESAFVAGLSSVLMVLTLAGEFSFIVWLLVMGDKRWPWSSRQDGEAGEVQAVRAA